VCALERAATSAALKGSGQRARDEGSYALVVMVDSCARPLLALCAALALVGATSCYELRQASGQLDMFLRRRSISSLHDDPRTTARDRDRLRVLWFARDFALRELGLNASESYQSVVVLDRAAVSYVVAAAPADRIEPYRWCFPFAGCLPYIGYFDRRDAVRERDRLAALGYDTMLRGVDAYSLGGWFPDPVYSPLLARTRGSIANTVIHELTHGTIFVASEARFNESVATFVGDHGSLLFLRQRYGHDSPTVRETLAYARDADRWEQHCRALSARLSALYAARLPRAETLRRKRALIASARATLTAAAFETRAYRRRASTASLNNADLATQATYLGDRALLEDAFRAHGGQLREFIAFLRSQVAPAPHPSRWLAAWVRRRTSEAPGNTTARAPR
jgi:predicted aminopeptidase